MFETVEEMQNKIIRPLFTAKLFIDSDIQQGYDYTEKSIEDQKKTF